MRIFFACIIAFALAACSTVNTSSRAVPQGTPQNVADKRIITDSTLKSYARVESVNESRVGGLLKVQAIILNSSAAARTVNYKFSWFDKNGMEIASTPTAAWRTLVLEGGEERAISAVATDANAVDFVLKLLPDVRD